MGVTEWLREEQEPFSGWDFAHLHGRSIDEQPPWDYMAMARDLVAGSSSVLDTDTGGGERLLDLRDALPPRTVATEGYLPNTRLAHTRLAHTRLHPHGIPVVQTGGSGSLTQALPFRAGSFDAVINRHGASNLVEVERVLRPGGTFLTQQVEGTAYADLIAAFDHEPPWPFATLDFMRGEIEKTALVVEIATEWRGVARFTDVGAVVYYLKAIPWLVSDFSVARHREHLERLQARLTETGELAFARKLLLVRLHKL